MVDSNSSMAFLSGPVVQHETAAGVPVEDVHVHLDARYTFTEDGLPDRIEILGAAVADDLNDADLPADAVPFVDVVEARECDFREGVALGDVDCGLHDVEPFVPDVPAVSLLSDHHASWRVSYRGCISRPGRRSRPGGVALDRPRSRPTLRSRSILRDPVLLQ